MRTLARAAALLAVAALAFPTTAHAAEEPVVGEVCEDAAGTTVVVDATDLGAGVQVGCAVDSEGMTGLQALEAAGFEVTPVETGGMTAVCRVNDLPADGETLDVDGEEYTEPCTEFPPAAAYWGYYVAEDGGSWEYAQTGADTSEATPGAYEGWRFQLNQPMDDTPFPAFDPADPPTVSEAIEDAAPADEEDSDDSSAVIWAAAGVTLLVVIGIGIAAARRRRAGDV